MCMVGAVHVHTRRRLACVDNLYDAAGTHAQSSQCMHARARERTNVCDGMCSNACLLCIVVGLLCIVVGPPLSHAILAVDPCAAAEVHLPRRSRAPTVG